MKKPLSTSIAALFLIIIQNTYGVDGTWTGASSTEWTDGTNWSSNPTVPDGTATFTNTGPNTVDSLGAFSIGTIQFTAAPNAQAYTINVGDFAIINGSGVFNNSTNTQTFNLTSTDASMIFQNASTASGGSGAVNYNNSGFIHFQSTSTAGAATIINNEIMDFDDTSTAGTASITNNVELDFFTSSSAGSANITNSASGTITFNNSSTAATSTIVNSGSVQFSGSSTAASAHLTSNSGGTIVFGDTSTASASTITTNNGGTVTFNNTTTASAATITNNGPVGTVATGLDSSGNVIDLTTTNQVNVGMTTFHNTSTAATAQITNNHGGETIFTDSSLAGTAQIANNTGGITLFQGSASASSATLTNNTAGYVLFSGTAVATNATTITNNATAILDISSLTNGGISIGQVTGAGNIYLGANNLTIGGQNAAANIGGVISDGHAPNNNYATAAALTGGSLTKVGTATLTLSGSSTYTGATVIENGTIQLGVNSALPSGTAVTLNAATGSGTALLDLNGKTQTIASLAFIAPATLGSGSTVDLNGGTLTLNGNISVVDNTTAAGNGFISRIQDTAGTGALDLGGAVRTFTIAGQNVNNQDLTVSAKIQNGGVTIAAANSGTQGTSAGVNFTAANLYAGGTTISSGFLLANNTTGSATGSGGVTIQSGGHLAGNGTAAGTVALQSGGFLEAGQLGVGHGTQGTLHVGAVNFAAGGQINLELGTNSDLIAVTGLFNKVGAGSYAVQLTDAGGIGNQTHYQLVTFAASTFAATDFTLAPTSLAGLTGIFTLTGTELDFDVTGILVTGSLIQNSAPQNTPTSADFTVTGAGTTGTPLENNTVKSLAFQPGSSLNIYNTLTITNGPVNLAPGASIHLGTSPLSNATLSASQLNVVFGSALTGNGTIAGNLVNSGLVSPGNSPGTITVTQDYRQTSTGTLRIEIGGRDRGEYDLLAVGGHASLDGKLELVRLNHFELRRGDKITFLTAGQGVDGEFASVANGFAGSTILQPTVVYDAHKVSLELIRGSFEKYAAHWGLTPNQRATAEVLDSVSHDRPNHKALLYLDQRNLSKLPGDFDRIAPEELTSVATIAVSMSTVQGTNLQRRTDDIRSGANGFSAAGLAVNGQTPSYSGNMEFRTGAAGPNGNGLRDGKESKDVQPAVDEEKRWGAFLTGTGEWVDVDGDGNARGYDLTTGGFTVGLDYKVSPNFALGIAAGYAGTTADLTGDGRVWVNGGKLGLYGTFYQSPAPAPAPTMSKDSSKAMPPVEPGITGGFYADFGVFGGYNSYDTKRSALQGDARGSTEGGELNVLVGAGYDWKIGALTIGPTATFNYTLVGMDGFTEHGSLAPLAIGDQTTESLRSTVGFRASYDWKVGGVLIKPELRAAWQHEYGDTSYDLTSSFAGGAGNDFLVRGPEIGRDSLLLGAGFAVQLSETVTTYFYYDGELARESFDRHSVSGGVRVAF